MEREVVLVKNETIIQIIPSYFLKLHGMCLSSTIGKYNNLIGIGYNSKFHVLLPWSMSVIAYYNHMGYILALDKFYEV